MFGSFSVVLHWLAICFRNPLVAGSNPAADGQGYELLKIIDFFRMSELYIACLRLC